MRITQNLNVENNDCLLLQLHCTGESRTSGIDNTGLKYLWARKRLKLLSDYNNISYNEDLKDKLEQLALKYSLLSEFTSFVAVS